MSASKGRVLHILKLNSSSRVSQWKGFGILGQHRNRCFMIGVLEGNNKDFTDCLTSHGIALYIFSIDGVGSSVTDSAIRYVFPGRTVSSAY